MIHWPFLYLLSCLLLIESITFSDAFISVKQKQGYHPSTYDKHQVFVSSQRHGQRKTSILKKNQHEDEDNKSIIDSIRGGGKAVLASQNSLPKCFSLLFSFVTLFYALSFKFFPLQVMSKFFGIIIEKDGINRFIVQLMGTNLFSLASTSYHGSREKLSTEECIAKGLQKRCIFFAILMITDRARGLGFNYKPLIMLEAFYMLCTYILSLSSGSDTLKSSCAKVVAAFSVITGSILFSNPNSYLRLFGVNLETQLTKNLCKIASSLILLNGLYLTTLVSGKFDPVQAVGLVSFASIPIAFQFQNLAGFSLVFSAILSIALTVIGTVALFGEVIEDEDEIEFL